MERVFAFELRPGRSLLWDCTGDRFAG